MCRLVREREKDDDDDGNRGDEKEIVPESPHIGPKPGPSISAQKSLLTFLHGFSEEFSRFSSVLVAQIVDLSEECVESQIVNMDFERAPGGDEAAYPEIGVRVVEPPVTLDGPTKMEISCIFIAGYEAKHSACEPGRFFEVQDDCAVCIQRRVEFIFSDPETMPAEPDRGCDERAVERVPKSIPEVFHDCSFRVGCVVKSAGAGIAFLWG